MNIKFTYELELDKKLAFLDVCVTRINKNEIPTSAYRIAADTNIYINWHSHGPSNWKTGTLRKLIKRAKLVSSTKLLLRNEINYIQKVFTENNYYLHKVVNLIIQDLTNIIFVCTDFCARKLAYAHVRARKITCA